MVYLLEEIISHEACLEDVDRKLLLDLDKAKHDQNLLDTFDLILKKLVDLSQTELIPADKSIFVVKKNSV